MNDLVSRQAAIDAVHEEFDDCLVWDESGKRTADEFEIIINRLPSAQPERKRGRWIYGEDNPGTGRDGWFCSECEHFEMWDYSVDMKSAELNLPNYCPNCGADMRGEQDE